MGVRPGGLSPGDERSRPSRDDLRLVGTLVDGRYLVEAEAGVGGFGVVYRARHVVFDSPVALKVLVRDTGDLVGRPCLHPPGTTEGRLLFRLSALHPAFVRVLESGCIEHKGGRNLPYLAMEWLEGCTLKSHLEALRRANRRIPLQTALHLFDDLVGALSIAHQQQVAHRDLKPANVYLVQHQGYVAPKLLDFGLAKVGNPQSDAFYDTGHQTPAFTPAYAAPEQWVRSLGATGTWTDVYSLALVLVELLVGGPWSRQTPRTDLMALALDNWHRPTPGTLGVRVSDAVEATFLRALAVEPHERYPNVSAFWVDLCAAAQWTRPNVRLSAAALGIDVVASGSPGLADEAITALPVNAWVGSETRVVATSKQGALRAVRGAASSERKGGCREVERSRWPRSTRIVALVTIGGLVAGVALLARSSLVKTGEPGLAPTESRAGEREESGSKSRSYNAESTGPVNSRPFARCFGSYESRQDKVDADLDLGSTEKLTVLGAVATASSGQDGPLDLAATASVNQRPAAPRAAGKSGLGGERGRVVEPGLETRGAAAPTSHAASELSDIAMDQALQNRK